MNPERWEEIEEILQRAIVRPVEDRPTYLDRACGADGTLRSEVESFLDAYDRSEDFMENPSFDALRVGPAAEGAADPEDVEPEPGDLIGPYRLESHLGSGGMSRVYRAVRRDRAFDRVVAVKLIKRGMETEEVVRRFHQERQILADLDHPNIARILDGGSTGDGRPYFVMEYIEGTPIDDFCDQRRLAIADRLRLFRTVCSAVHYAHRRLVIHRDIKPANILITGDATPKLLDFGIAKLLDPGASWQTVLPRRRLALTPSYASPEQAAGQKVTTATDVYSLGVLLYRLLTGRLPVVIDPRRPPLDLARVLREARPRPPSVAVRRVPDRDRRSLPAGEASAAGLAARRRSRPQQLSRQLAGDLDTIVARATHREPDQRYPSAQRLAEDLERHLDGLPVWARPDSLGYRARKFVRRHRFAVAAGILIGLAAVGAAVGMGLQAASIRRERDRALAERVKSERVAAFFTNLFTLADPSEARGRSVTVREVLDDGIDRFRRELADQPEIQAHVLHTAGEVYRGLGALDEAGRLLEEAVALRRQLPSLPMEDLAESVGGLAQVVRQRGDITDAEALHLEALELFRRSLGDDHPRTAKALSNRTWYLVLRGEYAEAERLQREAIAVLTRGYGDRHPALVPHLTSLGETLSYRGEQEEATSVLRRAVTLADDELGDDHVETVAARKSLARVLTARGLDAAAERELRRVLETERRLFGEYHPALGYTLNQLAVSLDHQQKDIEAEAFYRESLAVRIRVHGPLYPAVAVSMANLGNVLRQRGRYAEAEAKYREALEIVTAGLPPGSPENSYPMIGLARVLVEAGRPGEAEPLLRRAISLRDGAGLDPVVIADARIELGRCLLRQGRLDEAEAEFGAADAHLAGKTDASAHRQQRKLASLREELPLTRVGAREGEAL